MSDNYQKALNKIKNDRKFLKFVGCCNNGNVNGVTGPTGPTGATGPTGPTGSVDPNPYDLYVQSTAASGGNGSQLSPFQTIPQALAVAEPNSIINVLSGTYPVTEQNTLNIPGLILKGRAGSTILLQASVIPFLCNSDNITIDGFTMTSDNPYPVEFIQIGGNNNQILNCQIYGPNQSGDSSTWVVNRGFVTQNSINDLLVRNNIFHTLRQPAYLNPNSTGTIMDNVTYNTRGFVVDQASFLFSGNSWEYQKTQSILLYLQELKREHHMIHLPH